MTIAICSPSRSTFVWTEDDSPYIGVDHASPTQMIGGGPELREIKEAAMHIWDEYTRPASRQIEGIRDKFHRLASRWRTDTAFQSSVHQMATHPAYQEIIGMGRDAIPLILRELERDADHWFWALRSITGIDPVPPANRGNVREMANAWLSWAHLEGHL